MVLKQTRWSLISSTVILEPTKKAKSMPPHKVSRRSGLRFKSEGKRITQGPDYGQSSHEDFHKYLDKVVWMLVYVKARLASHLSPSLI